MNLLALASFIVCVQLNVVIKIFNTFEERINLVNLKI